MKKILKYIIPVQMVVLAFALFSMGGCKSYDDPAPERLYTDADMAGQTRISIADVKKMYTDVHGTDIAKAVVVNSSAYVKAMVTSSDERGNLYRVIYIQDETGGIELKVGTTTNYNSYKQGQIVYVYINQLTLGNYRHNLSLGGAVAESSEYANGYIDVLFDIRQRVLKGEILDPYANSFITIPVITSPSQLNDSMIGSMLRFEGLTSTWGSFDGANFPSFLEQKDNISSGVVVYTDYPFVSAIQAWRDYEAGLIPKPASPRPGHLLGPTYAFKDPRNNLSYYGTALFKLGTSTTDPTHNLLLRTSGFSLFALELVPANGKKVNMWAVYNKHSSKTGGFIKYQLLINDSKDVEVVQ